MDVRLPDGGSRGRLIRVISEDYLSIVMGVEVMEGLVYSMLKKTFDENCGSDKPTGVHFCFQCGQPFKISDASYCSHCGWWHSAVCGHCGCSLSLEDRVNLELAFKAVCGGTCKLNPKKRKSSDIIRGASREQFLEWASKYYPDWFEEYRAGRMDFDELHREIHKLTGLTWIFRD